MSAPRRKPGRGRFIVLEGLDGAGTTTQAERFAHQVLQCKTSEEIRRYLNERLHEVSSDLEHHFTEHAASLTFMASHRYFMRLAAIAASLAGTA